MSNFEDHNAEQAAITAACEAGTCDHPDCDKTWQIAVKAVYDGSVSQDLNDERAARAVQSLYPAYSDAGLTDAIRDTLTDIRHLCDLMGWRYSDLDRDAYSTYRAEVDHCGIARNETLAAVLEQEG